MTKPIRRLSAAAALITFVLSLLLLSIPAPARAATTGTVTGSVVNIRSGPGTSYGRIGRITRGTPVQIIKTSGGWYQIRLAGGRTGWVAAYLVKAGSSLPAVNQPSRGSISAFGAVQVAGTAVNLRKGPGTSYPIAGRVNKGTILSVVGSSGQWYQVVGPGIGPGYIASWLVKPLGTSSAPPSRNTGNQSATVKAAVANLRSGPGTNFPRTGQVKKGETVQIIRASSGWYQVKTVAGRQGWIAGWLLQLASGSQPPVTLPNPPANTSQPSRGSERDVPQPDPPEPPEPSQPLPVVEGDIQDISELVAGNIQVVSIRMSVAAAYESQKGDKAFTLTLKGIRKGSASGIIRLSGKGADQVTVEEKPDTPPSTVLTFSVLNTCIFGVTPAEEGRVIKVFIKTTENTERTGPARVVLDAGHGGSDPGAVGPSGTQEKTINLPIILEAGRILSLDNIEVVYTRSDDRYVSLIERSNIANQAGADLFVSVHCNGSSKPEAEGTSTYYYAPPSNPVLAAQAEARSRLAACLQNALLQELGRKNLGIRQDNFSVLRETVIPCALVETMFITNPDEEMLLGMATTQLKAGAAVARGIEDYLRQVGRLQ